MPEQMDDGTVVFQPKEYQELAGYLEAMRDFTERTMGEVKEFVNQVDEGNSERHVPSAYENMKGLCNEWFGPADEELHDDDPSEG